MTQDPVQASQPLTQQTPNPGVSLRRIYERPSTTCSKPQRWVLMGPSRVYVPGRLLNTQPLASLRILASLLDSATARVKHNSESERRSPSSEDDRDERESRAEIQNAEDYNEIFQPKNSISEAIFSPTPQPGTLLWLYPLNLTCTTHWWLLPNLCPALSSV